MHIVHFIESMDPTHGGPPAIVARLTAAQARLGHDVTLLTTAESSEASEAVARVFGQLDRFDAVRRKCVNARSIAARFAKPARHRMAEALHRADIVHIHAIWDPLLMRAMRHCRRHGIPLCVTPHGLLTRNNMNRRAWKKKLALALGWTSAINGAGVLHCLTDDEGTDARALGLTAPLAVLPNAVDPTELSVPTSEADLRRVLPAHASSRFILSLGRLHTTKGLDILCDAFAAVAKAQPDVDLVIAGPDFGYEATLRNHIARLSLEHRIHIVGAVFGADKVALLRSAQCLCQPSRQEGFSMSILEALACGTPAVISTECHFADLQTARAGLVVPLDPRATAGALLNYLQDEAVRREAAAAAIALIEERFTVDRLASSLIDHYRTLGALVP